MYKIRLNLGRGENYMKWKIIHPNGIVAYYDPELFTIGLYNAKLRNFPKAAKEIFAGGNKRPCAWVEAKSISFQLRSKLPLEEAHSKVRYNPRDAPYWTVKGVKADNIKLKYIFTHGTELFEGAL